MDLQKALGQLFIIGFHGTEIAGDHPIYLDIKKRNLGGVILFERLLAKNLSSNNITSASQVKNLTSSLQKAAGNGLLIGVDQEGGKVCRFTSNRGFPISVSAAELGKHDDTVLTQINALVTAELLRTLGINLNMAPVVDLNIIPNNPIIGALGRSFSAEADKVIRHAEIWIKTHRSRNILSCLKHFPGHGSSRDDSHLGLVDISNTWTEEELRPFAELIRRGCADVIMTGHLFNRSLDPDHPATLSRNTITGLLRKKLEFEGVIISDDLQMKALTEHYGLDEMICKSFAAGVDMITIGNNLVFDPEILPKAIQAVLRGLKKGELKEERIAASLERIRILKEKFARLDKPAA